MVTKGSKAASKPPVQDFLSRERPGRSLGGGGCRAAYSLHNPNQRLNSFFGRFRSAFGLHFSIQGLIWIETADYADEQ